MNFFETIIGCSVGQKVRRVIVKKNLWSSQLAYNKTTRSMVSSNTQDCGWRAEITKKVRLTLPSPRWWRQTIDWKLKSSESESRREIEMQGLDRRSDETCETRSVTAVNQNWRGRAHSLFYGSCFASIRQY